MNTSTFSFQLFRNLSVIPYIKLARPKHWIKNVFIVMPVPFALAAGQAQIDVMVFVLGFFGFSLINSSVYAFNDALDVEADRLHPKKCKRPIAACLIPVPVAYIYSGTLALAGLGLTLLTGILNATFLAVIYLAANLVYTLKGKEMSLVDVFLLTSGFIIRVILGCALLGVAASNWLLLCTGSLALFMGFAKRRADLVEGMTDDHRKSLAGYNVSFLNHAMTVTACLALVSYALYSVESTVLLTGRQMACMPFVAYGILFYLREAHVSDSGGSPVEIALRSRNVWACMIGWGIAASWSVGLW